MISRRITSLALRLALLALLLLTPLEAWALTRTISVAGGNWNATSAWDEASVPVAGDAVVARGGGDSGNLTVNVASATASIVLTNYVGTLTFNNTLTVTSTVTFVAGMSIAGTGGTLISATTSTLTSGGKTLTCALTLTGTATYTLADNWTVNGLVTLGASTLTTTLNGNTLNAAGGISIGGSTSTVAGTTVLKMTGTGTLQSAQSGAGKLQNSLTFAAGGGTITVSGTIRYSAGTILYTDGTMSMGSSILLIRAATTLNTSGMTWADITSDASSTITLSSGLNWSGTNTHSLGATVYSGAFNLVGGAWTINGATTGTNTIGGTVTLSGALTLGNTTSTTFSGAFAISAASCTISGTQTVTPAANQAITISGTTTLSDANTITASGTSAWNTGGLTTTGAWSGTQGITFTGTGTWTGAAGAVNSSVTINTGGTLTLSGTILFAASGTPTLTYTAGTVTQGTSILSIASSCTITNTNAGMTLHDVLLTAALTLTLNTNTLVGDGTLTMPNAAVTLGGTAGATFATFANTTLTVARTYTLTAGNTYTCTTGFNWQGATAALPLSVVSSHGTNTFALVVYIGASQDVGFVTATRVDSSAGQEVFDYKGSLTTATNWTTTYSCGGWII